MYPFQIKIILLCIVLIIVGTIAGSYYKITKPKNNYTITFLHIQTSTFYLTPS